MTETQIREKVVAAAKAWLGCKESDGSHRQIVDVYNSHRPLSLVFALVSFVLAMLCARENQKAFRL